jgi:acetyltransferase
MRYAGTMNLDQRVAHTRLVRICFNDYDRELALVAERPNPETDELEILGIGRLTKLQGTNDGEFALLVRDDAQGMGLGTELLRRLVRIGREEGLDRIVADILVQNRPMQEVARNVGFQVVRSDDFGDPMIKAVRVLNGAVEEEG